MPELGVENEINEEFGGEIEEQNVVGDRKPEDVVLSCVFGIGGCDRVQAHSDVERKEEDVEGDRGQGEMLVLLLAPGVGCSLGLLGDVFGYCIDVGGFR